MLKYNVAGDCLAIKLAGDLKLSLGQDILNKFNFGVKLNFSLIPSPVLQYLLTNWPAYLSTRANTKPKARRYARPEGRALKADFLSWQKLLATIFFQKKSVK